MKEINLVIYREPNKTNFGDELSFVILEYLFKKYNLNYKIILNNNRKINICFIGSLISWTNLNYDNIYILGGGIRTENDNLIKKKMKIFSVRGPLTRYILKKNGYKSPKIYGDPALLLPQFYTPSFIDMCKDKIGIVGHLTNFYKYVDLSKEYILINPTWEWKKVINYITSCKLILSSSLHGLIISDAYNVPNIWLDEYPLNEGSFKFKDYFLSQKRNIKKINKIEDYKNSEIYIKGNNINLINLENAFKKMHEELKLLEINKMELNQKSHATEYNRYPEIFKEIKEIIPSPNQILSFGCSTGLECETLHELYFPDATIIGLDINEKIIENNITKNKYNNIKYYSKLENITKSDLIFANSVLCRWPESEGEYTFETFENTLEIIDSLLNKDGYLCIYNSKYLFSETNLFNKNYEKVETKHKETGFVTKYHKNNQKIKDTYPFFLFKKIALK